jgi:(p)ppGpp synthase/HD superfamily hydrolase
MQTAAENTITRAATLARKLHYKQVRKSSGDPYFDAHLWPVAQMVYGAGGDTETVVAAIFHDSIEDVGAHVRPMILGEFGPRVLALVEECTEIGTGNGAKAPWQVRKDAYLEQIAAASSDALLIKIADKLQSVEELVGDVEAKRDAAYLVFNAGKERIIWFHRALCTAFRDRMKTLGADAAFHCEPLLVRFEEQVAKLV